MIRTRHELAEKIRQITREITAKRERNRKWETQNLVETKTEAKIAEQILLSSEQQTLKPIIFYQATMVSQRKGNHNITTYIYTMSTVPKENNEPPPEPMPSQSTPNRPKNIKRKRRRSSTYARVEELLARGKNTLVLPEPSEESISDEDDGEGPAEVPRKTINDLSEDILQKIFWYFNLKERCTVLSRVCKTWNYILKNPIFWTHLEFDGEKVATSDMLRLITISPLLSSLTLIRVPDASVILHELCREKPDLKELALRYCSMNRIDCVHVLLRVPTSFPQLEVLDLEGTEFHSTRFFTEICLLSELKSLNLGANKHVHARDLMTISLNCRKLDTLKILNIPFSSKKSSLKDANFVFIMNRLEPNLVHLECDMSQLTGAAYLAILRCKKLKILCLTNCLFLTGKIFQNFHQLADLKTLKLNRAICLMSHDFENLFANGNLKNIETLDISGCWQINGAGLEAIAKGLPLLKELSLEKCISINSTDLSKLSNCKHLSTLNIAHGSFDSDDVTMFLSGARRLRALTIDHSMCSADKLSDLIAISPKLKVDFAT